jgi:signal peptidase I
MSEAAVVLEPSARLQEMAPRLWSELLRRCGEARIRVAGTSMLPLIRPGDVLLVRSLDMMRVKRNDVILFTAGQRLFAHRVVRVERRGDRRVLITRGDMHDHDDPAVTESQFLGRIEGQSRHATVISSDHAHLHRHRGSPFRPWMTGLRRAMHRGAQAMRSVGAPRATG